ncbi:MAG TPA: hypothetical protein VKR99_07790, partial [Candidatus Eremiobacteraceae bacterium]|nr:hypothetical protein [Candidatus Eremiobacteraceae bacterium]
MSGAVQMKCTFSPSGIAVLTAVTTWMLVAADPANAQAPSGSPGPLANSCGVPPAASSAAGGAARLPVFP